MNATILANSQICGHEPEIALTGESAELEDPGRSNASVRVLLVRSTLAEQDISSFEKAAARCSDRMHP